MTSKEYRKVILAALFYVLAFIIGVLIGYFSREAWYKVESRIKLVEKLNRDADNTITQKIFDKIDSKRLDSTLRDLLSTPRLAGTKNDKDSGYYIHKEYLKYGLQSDIAEYNVTLSYPGDNHYNYVAVEEHDGREIFRSRVDISGEEVQPYLAYSPSGSVKGDLVFANYARLHDFLHLKYNGINCTGKIVIAKYGQISLGNKVEYAHKFGAIGIILYPDPADYAMYSNVSGVYPYSIFLPDDGAQLGNIVLNKGDQSTPGYPSNEYAYRLTDDELKQKLPQIPSFPISYRNAYNILRHMTGETVPDEWKGGLNITYRKGPGLSASRKVILNVNNTLEYKTIYNIIGKIEGDIEPDRYVIVGNHRDAWIYGSIDPTSGTIVMIEMARVFGQLYEEGWRPRRTILFCSWDAEEFGLVGSYEWVEENIKWLFPNAVAYINMDSIVTGNDTISLQTVPLLQTVFEAASKKVPDPHGRFNSVYEAWTNNKRYNVNNIGGGSDHVPFIAGAGIPSLYARYSYVDKVWSDTSSPLYHSKYEDYHAFTLIDPEMKFSHAITSVLSELLRNLSDSRIIPFDVVHYAEYILKAARKLASLYKDTIENKQLDHLQKSINALYESSVRLRSKIEEADPDNPLLIRQLNDRLMWMERTFLVDEGIPENFYLKHILHSPGSIPFPGLSNIQKKCDESRDKVTCKKEYKKHVAIIIHRIYSAAKLLDGQ